MSQQQKSCAMDELVGQCEASIKNWLESGGERSEAAKKSLLQLIQQHPQNSLPRRYLARLLFHEAAGAISPSTVGSNSSHQRIQLLTDAYEHAAVATDLSPNSLSCAALRATLAINLLVEESALLTPSPSPAQTAAGASSSGGGSSSSSATRALPEQQSSQPPPQQQTCTMLDRKCQELLQRFLGSIDACKTALEHPRPVLREPLITFTTATHTTCDPCSLLVEKIMDCSRAGKLQEVVAEKRSVLTSMQQVLQSCYALLDSTQVPLHSIIRLLQHILRPYGAEQQMLASSRVNTGSLSGASGSQSGTSSNPATQLPASQLHHAAIGELLRLLRPGSNQAYTNAAAAATAAAAAAAAATAASNAAAAAAGAAAAGAAAPAAITCGDAGGAAAAAAEADLAPLPLSVEKPWDPPNTAASPAGNKAASGAARGGAKGRAGRSRASGVSAGPGKKRERSRRERFSDVESFWRSCSPQQRLQLLRVPLAPLLAGVKQESGAAAAEVLMEGLVLLREQEHSSCYWLCAACDRKFHTASDFNLHLETCHEQLVLAKQQLPHKGPSVPGGPSAGPAAAAGKAPGAAQQPALQVPFSPNSMPPPASYVSCGKCQAPVVGMYYTRVPAHKQCPQPPAASPGEEDAVERMRNICMKCYRELAALMGEAGADRSYSKVSPHAPTSPGTAWSESGSEFISTRDSFSSCGEDGTSSGSLSDTEPSTAAAGAVANMQARQYDAAGRGSALPGAQPGLMSPDLLKTKPVLCPPWRFQQQRAMAWSSQGMQEVCAGPSTGHSRRQGLRPGEQQALEAQQQQQAATAAPGHPGIFVFGSNHNSTQAAGSSSSAPNSSVPAAGAAVAGAAGPGAAVAASNQQQQQASSSASSPAQQQGPPGSRSGLAAYWQQQQLLLCSTDAAAAELLEGLDVVQKAKQLDSKQHRHHAGVSAQRQSCGPAPGAPGGQLLPPGPVTGTKRSAASAAAPAPAPALAAAGLCLAPAGAPPFQAPPAVNTGSAAAAATAAAGSSSAGPADAPGGAAAGGSYDLAGCAGADSGTPSAGNRTWRDWLLPKKLLQWNDDEGAELLQDDSAHGSDDDIDDVIVRGVDQGSSLGSSSSRAQEQQRAQDGGSSSSSRCQQPAAGEAAALGVGGGSSSSGRVGCSEQDGDQQQGRRVPTVVVTELSDDAAAAADIEGSDQATGSAPCSPRTPSAHDSCRGAPDTAASASQQAAAAAAACDVLSTHSCSTPPDAAAAAATGAAVDSLGACLAAAAPAVLVDEVMRCMQHLYDSDPDVADETLLCLVDFLQRKLNPKGYKRVNCDAAAAAVAAASRRSASNSALNLEQVSPAAAAAAAAAGVGADDAALAAELLVAPEVAFLCPRAMRAAMCCLGSDDLQMALAYIVRQSGAPLAGANVEIDSTCGSSAGGSLGSSSGAGSVTGDDDDGADSASQTDSQESEEESGCMALFQLYHLDEVAFEQLVAQLWPGELRLCDAAADAGPAAAPAAAAGKAAGGKHGRSVQQQAGKGAPSSTKGGGSSGGGASSQAHRQKDRLEPVLLVSPWWLEHLRQSSKNRDPAGDAEADTRVLRWVYGNIESAQAEELASRQASLRGGLDRTAALLELYEGLAEAWRRMQRVADRQRRLEQLRSRVKAKFADVKALEEAAQHGTSQQAAAFLDALKDSLSPVPPAAAPAPGSCPPGSSTTAQDPAAAAPAAVAEDSALAAAGAAGQQHPPAPAARAAAAAAVALSPLMQLTTYMTKLAPLYLCEAAVAAVRAAPLLASEASMHYACALLERELAVLALMEAKLEHDVAAARQRLQAANDRLLAKRGTELAAAEAEQAKLIAEGPASHRKKDLLDKATKETEHRQKLADVKARIEAAKAAIAEDEALAASAELAAAEGTAALLHVQDLARQMNMRLKTLQDFNAQLAALLPPLRPSAAGGHTAVHTAHRGAAAVLDGRRTSSSTCSAAYGSPTSNSMDSSSSSNSPQADGLPVATAAPSSFADAHAEWTLRARRLECLMCRVLWVAETIRLFDGQYDASSVTASSSSSGSGSAAAAAGSPPAATQGVSAGLHGPQGFSQARTTPADMLGASRWVKEQSDELDANFHAAAEELGLLRSRIQQLACVDLTFEIHESALNYIRRRIEAAATAAQEMRSQQLLLELAAEEEASKKPPPSSKQQHHHQQQASAHNAAAAAAAATAADSGGDSIASASSAAAPAGTPASQPQPAKGAKGKKAKQEAKPAASKPTPKASGKQLQQAGTKEAEEQAKKVAAERQQALEAARAAREAAIEAELEKRRQELLAMEEAAEAELIRLAEEASLKEQHALKEAAEQECQRREQQAREAAAASAAAAAATAAAAAAPAAVASSPKPLATAGSGATTGGSSTPSKGPGSANRNQAGSKQQGAAGVKGAVGPAGAAAADHASAASTAAAGRPAAQRAMLLTGPGASTGKAAGKGAAVRPGSAGSAHAAAPAAFQSPTTGPGGSSRRQQQQQQQAAGAAVGAGAGKKAGRGSAAGAAGNGRGSKGHPGSAGSTPSKQQRHQQQKQQERAQQTQAQPQQPQQPVPMLLDFGPTPAEAYAAGKQAAAGAQHSTAQETAQLDRPALGQQQEHMQGPGMVQQEQLAPPAVHAAAPAADSPVPAAHSPPEAYVVPLEAPAGGTPVAAAAAAAPGHEAFGLTAADAVVHMPTSTANSSSHLALLSQQGSHDALSQPMGASGSEPRTLFDSSNAPLSAAPGSAFSTAAGSSSQSFTADAPLSGFSPAPGGHLLSLGSGHLQLQAATSDAVRTLSAPTSLISNLGAPAQGFGSQDLGLGFGLGSFPASRQGSAGLQGGDQNPVGSKGAAGMMLGGVGSTASAGGSAVSAPLAAAGAGSGHLLPPRPSLGGSTTDGLMGAAALDAAGAMFAPAAAVSGLGVQLSGPFSAAGSGLEPSSPQLGCSPAEDALHIQSIMSLLDDTGASTPKAGPGGASSSTGRSGSTGKGGKQQPQKQQQRQQRQKQQQQPRPPSRGRNSGASAPDGKAASAARNAEPAAAAAVAAHSSGSSGGDSFLPAGTSSTSSGHTIRSPLRPPGLSAAPPASLSSRPSSAGSTSTAAGDSASTGMQRQQQQQQLKQLAQTGGPQLWPGPYSSAGSAGQGYGGGGSWPGSDAPGPSSSDVGLAGGRGRGHAAVAAGGQSSYGMGGISGPMRGADSPAAAAAAAMAASGGMWGAAAAAAGSGRSDATAGRDQTRPLSAGLGGYPSAAQVSQAHNAHLAAATAAAAAAAAATAAVKQAQQQAAAAAAANGLHGRSSSWAGLYSQGQDVSAALFGNSSGLLGVGGSGLGLAMNQGYMDAAGSFSGLSGAMSGLPGGLGAAHAAAAARASAGGLGASFGDVGGLWQQQQQAAALRFQGGLGGLQQSLQQQQQQQQQMWSRPPGGQGVQW